MGRYRRLPDIVSNRRELRSHSERAAINTPLQGGAADVVMKAMVLIDRDERLRKLGWRMLLQIHDELILEGPEESKDEALRILLSLLMINKLGFFIINVNENDVNRNHREFDEEPIVKAIAC